jgi:hypothetical protein
MKKNKRILALLAITIFVVATMYSCKASHDCAAYGEVKKYQKEVRR